MQQDHLQKYSWAYIFVITLLLFAAVDWQIYKAYKARYARKAAAEQAITPRTP